MKQAILAFIGLSNLLFAQTIEPLLIGGTPADPQKWPFVVWLKMNGGLCTATVVGSRAVITAAHCVETGETAQFTINNKTYRAVFTRHPKYSAQDWDVSIGVTQETIDTTPISISRSVAVGDSVHLMGYGCIRPGGSGGNDGILREGDAKVTQLATYDIVTKSNVALCFGDSGGPAFSLKDGKISQVGINSKGNISDTSYDTKLWEEPVVSFLKSWSDKNNAPICGITQNCSEDPQPPIKEIAIENSIIKLNATIKSEVDVEFARKVLTHTIDYIECLANRNLHCD